MNMIRSDHNMSLNSFIQLSNIANGESNLMFNQIWIELPPNYHPPHHTTIKMSTILMKMSLELRHNSLPNVLRPVIDVTVYVE